MKLFKPNPRPTLRSVIGRGHLAVALLAIGLASLSLTCLGVLALRVYADHNLHLIARSISYTVEAAVVFNDSGAAADSLALIASTEEVADAKVYDSQGQLLASWQRPDSGLLANLEMHIASAFLEIPSACRSFARARRSARSTSPAMAATCCAFSSAAWWASCCASP